MILTRYDLWPAMLTVGALCALVSGRDRLGFGVLGLAAAAKLWPALHPAARRGLREQAQRRAYGGRCPGGLPCRARCGLHPVRVLSPGGLADSFSRQMDRPLQIESLGSSLLLAAHQVGDYEPTVVSSFGSQNLVGGLPDSLATVLTIVQVLVVIALWILSRPGAVIPRSSTAASAAVVAAFIAFGKVLSPQFLIWLVPLVPLVLGRLGLVAAGLVLVLVLTQLWFPVPTGSSSRSTPGPAGFWLPGTLRARSACRRVATAWHGDPNRLARGSAAVVIAVDESPLDTHVAVGRVEPNRHAGAHPLDGELRPDADDGVVRARHAGVGQRGRATGQHPGVVRLHVGVGADDGGDCPVEQAREGDLLARRLGVEVDDRPSTSLAEPPRRGSRRSRTDGSGSP